ncbi:MAG: hypothetical protein J6V05_02005 [Alistipes sp.]|nr:hypothetical protein [Alistipes sp.]
MKKLFSVVALCAIALTTLSSCEKIEGLFGKGNNSEETYEPSDLTPTEHQAKLEQIAIDLLDQINPADVEELAYSLMTLSERLPEDIYGDEGYVDEYARSIKNFDVNSIVALTTRASEQFIIDINDPEFGVGGFSIEITEDGEVIEGELDDPRAIVIKWDNDALTLSWGENKGQYTMEDSEEGVTYIVKVPAYIKVAITVAGKEHFSAYIEPNITDNYTYAPAVTVKLNGGYELYGKSSANNKGISAEASFKKNGTKLFGGAVAFDIKGMTNPENWYYEYYDEYFEETVTYVAPEEYFIENVTNGFAQFDILTLSIIGNGDLKKVINEFDDLDERLMDSDYSEKEYCDEGCAIINKYMKLVAIYNDTKEKIADVILQTELVEYYDEWEDMTYTHYDPVPVLVFPDGSKFLFEDFFNESGFGNLFERLGDIAGDIEY